MRGGALRISGEKRSRGEQQGRLSPLMERAYGHFERTIALPHNIEDAQSKVSYHDALLTVTLGPKTEALPPKQVDCPIIGRALSETPLGSSIG